MVMFHVTCTSEIYPVAARAQRHVPSCLGLAINART